MIIFDRPRGNHWQVQQFDLSDSTPTPSGKMMPPYSYSSSIKGLGGGKQYVLTARPSNLMSVGGMGPPQLKTAKESDSSIEAV
jgi:hypothetical protein